LEAMLIFASKDMTALKILNSTCLDLLSAKVDYEFCCNV